MSPVPAGGFRGRLETQGDFCVGELVVEVEVQNGLLARRETPERAGEPRVGDLIAQPTAGRAIPFGRGAGEKLNSLAVGSGELLKGDHVGAVALLATDQR